RAFLSLYDRYAARIHGLSMRMLRDTMSAEEVTQDAFLRVWTRAQTFNPDRGQVLSWLLAITRRLALDRFRLDSRAPPPSESDNPDEDLNGLADETSRSEEARWRSLRFALADLPAEQRLPIELAFYHGLSQREIAEQLRIPLGTVKTRVRLGMDKLRRAWTTDPIHSDRR
ncbi:MAG: sigma-70 family RNA polymerase sigma factor, partial [Anaerolineales bacterium]